MKNLKKKIRQSIFLLGVIAGSLVGQNQEIKAEALSSDLFIRSVFHYGTTINNMLEIFNGTGATVNLNNYYVSAYHNGGPGVNNTHQLPDINLPNGEAFLLGIAVAGGNPYAPGQQEYVNNFTYKLVLPVNAGGFSSSSAANDIFTLRKNSPTGPEIDVFGALSTDVTAGVGWRHFEGTTDTGIRYGYVEPGVNPTNYQNTLVRRPDVINPQIGSLSYTSYRRTNTSTKAFNPSEWGVFASGTFPKSVYRFNLFDDVNDVIDLINNLPNPITQNDASAVAAARTAYDALTSAQKGTVTNYADLQADEAAIEGFAKIIEVIELIDLIPDPLTLADESFVIAAKTAFDDLTSAEQLQVTNRQQLTDAITHINNLKAVQQLIADINALPSVITLAQAEDINAIREDYEALPLAQQELISNYATFVTKETEYFRLKGINDVEVLIDALPVTVALTDGVQLANARTAYNLLPSGDQAQVGNYALLTTAENHYLDLQAAQVVIDQIDEIDDPITLASRDEVTAARSALGLLTSTQQGLVTNKQRLIDVEAIITGLLDEVDDVINDIDALPNPVAITNLAELINAETAFVALSDDQEALVTNEPDLIQARTQMDAILAKIQDVITKIDLIVDPVTLAQTVTIETARTAFNALTADEKVFVTNDIKLFLAEEVIIDLNTPRYVVSYVVFNQIFSELVKSGTSVQNIPTSVTRLGFTFGGWVLEGTTTLVDLSTYLVTSGQRFVAVFNVDPTSNQSELLIDIEGLNNIDVGALFPNRDVSLQLNIDLLPAVDVPVIDKAEMTNLVSTQNTFTMNNIFFLDLSIVVTYTDNGVFTEETLPEINEPVDITVSIPALFRAFASYQVVRVHDGVPTFLDTVYDASAHSVMFSTDKFSTYGVLYSNAIVDDLMIRIDAIPVPATLADLASVQAIRADFNNLTAEQKLMITNLQLLINAENALQGLQDEIDAVIALILLIDDPVRLLDEAAIEAARAAYDDLDPLQQALVTNRQDLFDAESDLNDLYAGINDVITRIAALADPLRIADQVTVDAIRTSFNALNAEQQALVTNAGELTAAENAITALLNEINRVKGLIADLNDPTLLADEADIDAARLAYDALTTEQKTYIDNYTELTKAEADYQTLLDEIDAVSALILALVNPTTIASVDAIETARAAYNALTEEQKALVLNYTTLTTAEADYQTLLDEIDAVIALILDIDTPVMIADEAAIEAARAAYEALTIEQRGLVTNYLQLVNAETDLATLYAEIAAVNLLISELNNPITLEDDAEVNEAEEAYNLLTAEQKGFVIGFPTLTNAIDELMALKANIIEVQALIDALDKVILIADEQAIEDARLAYDGLSGYEQTFIVRLTNLTGAETDLATLYAEIAAVNLLISELNNPITLEDDAEVNEAVEAYDLLTAEQKTYVLGFPILANAVSIIDALKADINAVIALIIDLNLPITISQEVSTEAARDAYDALTEYEKTLVTNRQDLFDAELDLATLYAEIAEVNVLILALNDPITIADEAAVLELREAYEALTTEQQTFVVNVMDLTDAEAQLVVIQARIDAVIQLIIDLHDPIRIADEDDIEAARAAYVALSFLERTYVANVNDLIAAETDLATLYAEIEVVNDMIENLSDPINLDDEEALQEARDAYDDLTVEQQGFVNNFPSLVQAEVDYQTLLDEIDAVIALIAALPNPITLDDSDSVDAARDGFNELNALQQDRVTNEIGLLNAEARLVDLTLAEDVSDDIMILPFEDDVTLDHQETIEAARDAYDALTPSQQGMVHPDTLQHLINAENALQRLLNPPMVFDFFSLLPYHLASGFIVMILFFIKSRKRGA